ncbi:helix-turn-helix transcriptional regulator [Catenulispora sp. NL8]|uniref:Helix-turn-helix transcriptional regulator n=1 Tax=Catenulispora pinistramenti TaxID=2705254 RepID=A0ABS5KP52_9ACTN|nr:helix-turn-helix domain-containing protein [Catenulispora pinistramenti]MBS2547764.1 helix-turn-helix transcriptional regulator [Catenulispora pinistramenti]
MSLDDTSQNDALTEPAPVLSPQGLLEVDDPVALRALTHPVRIAVLEALTTKGPLTATEAGETIGASATTCSFHLRQLAKYGFVEEAGHGPGRRRPWRLTHLGISYSQAADDPRTAEAAKRLAGLVMGQSLVRLRTWMETRDKFPPTWQKAADTTTAVLFATPDELKALNNELLAVVMRYRAALTDPDRRAPNVLPVEVVVVGYPIERHPDTSGAEDA